MGLLLHQQAVGWGSHNLGHVQIHSTLVDCPHSKGFREYKQTHCRFGVQLRVLLLLALAYQFLSIMCRWCHGGRGNTSMDPGVEVCLRQFGSGFLSCVCIYSFDFPWAPFGLLYIRWLLSMGLSIYIPILLVILDRIPVCWVIRLCGSSVRDLDFLQDWKLCISSGSSCSTWGGRLWGPPPIHISNHMECKVKVVAAIPIVPVAAHFNLYVNLVLRFLKPWIQFSFEWCTTVLAILPATFQERDLSGPYIFVYYEPHNCFLLKAGNLHQYMQ